MGFDFDQMAPHYDEHRHGKGPYYETLLGLLQAQQANRVLELGAGTGNNTLAIHTDYPCALHALEPSRAMLQQARQKSKAISCLQGDAIALPYQADAFDFLYGTYMLHHVSALDALMRECYRVLNKGCAAFVTVSEDFIRTHPMNAWFPSFAKVDLARFQPIDEVCATMEQAGFNNVQFKHTYSPPRAIDKSYADKVANKFITTYALLPEAEFKAGVAQLKEDIATPGKIKTTIVREATLVWGYKNAN